MKNTLALAALALAVVAGASRLAAAQDYRYGDRDDRYYDRDGRYDNRDDNRYDNRYYDRYDNYRRGMHVAREFGFRDGAEMAREDMWRGKRFNPKPRGRYDDLDHGYRGEFGHKGEYRNTYDQAYRDGYANTFRERGYYRWALS
jgi:hypothetical protein